MKCFATVSAILLTICLCNCKPKSRPCLIDLTDIIKGSPRKLITVKDTVNRAIGLYDEGWDSLKGGGYIFYPNQFLKTYTFYQNKMPVYSESYDEHGYLISTKGSPMVARVINELGEDSVYVQVYFFRPMKSYGQLNIKINNNPTLHLHLEKDTVYSNIQSVTFGINTGNMNRLNLYSQIKYTDDCAKIEHILSDSISLMKDAHNELIPTAVR
jgi:hypothetical protein